MLDSLRSALDNLRYDQLWPLCISDPPKFFSLLCPRYLGKKRVLNLYHYLVGIKPVSRTFEHILLLRCESVLDLSVRSKFFQG